MFFLFSRPNCTSIFFLNIKRISYVLHTGRFSTVQSSKKESLEKAPEKRGDKHFQLYAMLVDVCIPCCSIHFISFEIGPGTHYTHQLCIPCIRSRACINIFLKGKERKIHNQRILSIFFMLYGNFYSSYGKIILTKNTLQKKKKTTSAPTY